MLLTIVVFAVVLSVLVFVHEFGHFWVAKKLGVKVEEFGLGLPPRAAGILRFQNGEAMPKKVWKIFEGEKVPEVVGMKPDDTIYSINWLPLGGFCKIKGENGEGENDTDSFVSKAIWKRISIISAGVIMNILLAMALFAVGYMIGLPQSVDDNASKAYISNEKIEIVQVMPGTPAEAAGLKAGDVVLAIDGNKITSDADLQNYNASRPGQVLDYQISRGAQDDEGKGAQDKILELKVTPANKGGKGEVGIAIVNTGLVKYPWYLAIWKGITTAITLLGLIIMAFYDLIKNLILGRGLTAEISGPVRIATMTGQYARMGFVYLLQFVGLLSLNLAVVNFLPIPALDGGRIIFLLIEKIKGSPVKREVEAIIHNVGFIILILLILAITGKEIIGIVSPLVNAWRRIF
jgi:regulator of sigma E protease